MCDPRAHEGFTLTEVMVTVIVVLLALSGLLAMQLGTTRANVDSMNHYRALAYAEELMEEIRETEWRAPCPDCSVACPVLGCDGTTPNRSVGPDGVGCVNPIGGPRVVGATTVTAVASATMNCAFTVGITPQACDTLGARFGVGYQDQIRPNSAAGCPTGEPYASPDNMRQNCDMPTLSGGAWVGGPPNPTQITFWRCVEMEDILPVGQLPPATIRRITIQTYWDDLVSIRRGSPHRVVLETERSRRP